MMAGGAWRSGTVAGVVLTLLGAALCAGCYSHSPLDPSPRVPIDAALLGAWNCVTADPEAPQGATVTFAAAPGAEREYRVTWREGDKEPDSFRAFISTVRGGKFLNIQPLEESQYNGWAFLRYSLPRSTVMYVEMVRDDPFKAKEASATAGAARATLEKALRLTPPPIQDYCVCIRPPAEDSAE